MSILLQLACAGGVGEGESGWSGEWVEWERERVGGVGEGESGWSGKEGAGWRGWRGVRRREWGGEDGVGRREWSGYREVIGWRGWEGGRLIMMCLVCESVFNGRPAFLTLTHPLGVWLLPSTS